MSETFSGPSRLLSTIVNVLVLGLLVGVPFTVVGSVEDLIISTTGNGQTNAQNQLLGWNLTVLGDINGDSNDDYAVGAPGYNSDQGRVYIFYGPIVNLNPSSATFTINGNVTSSGFGWSVRGIGDYNTDGKDDYIVGAPFEDRAYLFHGGTAPTDTSGARLTFIGDDDSLFGHSVAGIDYGGYGYVYGIIGAPDHLHFVEDTGLDEDSGSVFLFNLTAVKDAGKDEVNSSQYSISFRGSVGNSLFGFHVLNTGDLDGDGVDDLGITDPGFEKGRGAIFIQRGKNPIFEQFPYTYAPQMNGHIYGPANSSWFGWSAVSLGDIGGGGVSESDLIIGAPYYNEGHAYLFYGVTSSIFSLNLSQAGSSADVEFSGNRTGDLFGMSMALTQIAGPTNNAISIGAPGYDSDTADDCGAVYTFWGSLATPELAEEAESSFIGENQGDMAGYSVCQGVYQNPSNMRVLTSAPLAQNLGQGRLYLLERNQNAYLSQFSINPLSGGNGDTIFSITVNYTDPDNDDPEYVKVFVYDEPTGGTLLHELSLTYSHGLNAIKGLYYNIQTTLNNSVTPDDPEKRLYLRAETMPSAGTRRVITTQRIAGPVVDDVPPSQVKYVTHKDNPQRIEGTFLVGWDWPSEDDFGVGIPLDEEDKVEKLYIKVRKDGPVTDTNWNDADTKLYYIFSSAEVKNPGYTQRDFIIGGDTNNYNVPINPREVWYVGFRAVDDEDNLGPVSAPISHETWWRRPDIPPKIETVTLSDSPDDDGGKLDISWSPSPSMDTQQYWVFLSQSPIDTVDVNDTRGFLTPDVIVDKDEDPDAFRNTTIRNITSYSGGDLQDGQTYYAAVIAVNWLGQFNWNVTPSDPATVINDNLPPIPRLRGVAAADVPGDSGGKIEVTWTPTTDEIFHSYIIFGQRYSYGTINEAVMLETITERTRSSYVVTNISGEELEMGVFYTFTVLIKDHNMHMDETVDENNTAYNVLTINNNDITPKEQIKRVRLKDVEGDDGGALVITWDNIYVKEDFLYYNVYFDDEEIRSVLDREPIAVIRDNLVDEYTVNESTYGNRLVDGKYYYAAVTVTDYNLIENTLIDRGNNSWGPVKPINQMDKVPPIQPFGLDVDDSSITYTSFRVTWSTVSWEDIHDFNYWVITYKSEVKTVSVEVEGGRDVTSYTITNLERGTLYEVNLSIVDDAGNRGPGTDPITVETAGRNQGPYNVTIRITITIGEGEETTNLTDGEEMSAKMKDLGEIYFQGDANDDYSTYNELSWNWWITLPNGEVITRLGWSISIEIKESGSYQVSLLVVDEQGERSENTTVTFIAVAEEDPTAATTIILFVILALMLIAIPIVVFFVIKSGKKSKEKEILEQYESRKKEIGSMEPIYMDLPTWTCSCGTTQVPITESANCPACYESHEGIPIDGIDKYLQDHDLVLDEMNIKIPLGWQGQDVAISNAEKELEERKQRALEALEEEYGPYLNRGEQAPPVQEGELPTEGEGPPSGGVQPPQPALQPVPQPAQAGAIRPPLPQAQPGPSPPERAQVMPQQAPPRPQPIQPRPQLQQAPPGAPPVPAPQQAPPRPQPIQPRPQLQQAPPGAPPAPAPQQAPRPQQGQPQPAPQQPQAQQKKPEETGKQ